MRAAPAPAVEKGPPAGAHDTASQPPTTISKGVTTTSYGVTMIRLTRRRKSKLGELVVEPVEDVKESPRGH